MLQGNDTGQAAEWNGEPTLYEIKIKGEIDERRWQRWFDGMEMAFSEMGDTTITGPVTDQAQLYGMLSRLRDMALPLVSVRALSPLQPPFFLGHRDRPPARARWMLILLYLLLVGGMSSLTVYLALEVLHVALALMLMFFVLGGMSYAFAIADGGGWVWRGLTWLNWLGGIICLIVYLGVAGTIHPALLVGGICFILAAVLLYLWTNRARRGIPELAPRRPRPAKGDQTEKRAAQQEAARARRAARLARRSAANAKRSETLARRSEEVARGDE